MCKATALCLGCGMAGKGEKEFSIRFHPPCNGTLFLCHYTKEDSSSQQILQTCLHVLFCFTLKDTIADNHFN